MDTFVFYVAGLVAIAAALLVVTRKNPVHSAIFLVLFFTMISLDFLILRAPFLAVVQVLVYAGAIMVLFLFVIMLLNLSPKELEERVSPARKTAAAILAAAVFLLLAAAVRRSPTVQGAGDLLAPLPTPELAAAGETAAVGRSLFREQLLAFELVSILILVAIIGAIYLTKRRGEPAARAGGAAAAGTEARDLRDGVKELV
jgi:NADH-quinone oxidoreductase subunit J